MLPWPPETPGFPGSPSLLHTALQRRPHPSPHSGLLYKGQILLHHGGSALRSPHPAFRSAAWSGTACLKRSGIQNPQSGSTALTYGHTFHPRTTCHAPPHRDIHRNPRCGHGPLPHISRPVPFRFLSLLHQTGSDTARLFFPAAPYCCTPAPLKDGPGSPPIRPHTPMGERSPSADRSGNAGSQNPSIGL